MVPECLDLLAFSIGLEYCRAEAMLAAGLVLLRYLKASCLCRCGFVLFAYAQDLARRMRDTQTWRGRQLEASMYAGLHVDASSTSWE